MNWAANYRYRAERRHEPASLEALREIVSAAPRVRVLGTRHSFNDIADSGELVSLARMPADVVVDGQTVSASAGLKYGELATALEPLGLALHNLASLPHISLGGAIATATHGSGDANGNLATAVAGLELVTSAGDVLTVRRGDDDFDGMVVGLGALGAVTRVTLDVEPAYEVTQRVFEHLPWDALYEQLDAIMGAGYSVSVFTRWGATVDQVWIKRRGGEAPGECFGASPAPGQRHMIPGADPVHTTAQLGVAGLWSERLPHFRMGFRPSSGDELQSEYHVAREHAVAAIGAVRALADRLVGVLQVCELRSVAADELWMSPQYRQDTLGLHFTWVRDEAAVTRLLERLEPALAPFAARPHWGKLFLSDAAQIATLYERLPDFAGLARRLDARGAFRNAWFEARIGG